jgi:hypothetical protein
MRRAERERRAEPFTMISPDGSRAEAGSRRPEPNARRPQTDGRR